MFQWVKPILLVLVIGIAGSVAFLYSGAYPIGADDQHTAPVYWALETLRDRSVERAARDIEAPDLTDPDLLLSGGADYNDMCASCHLKPGQSGTDMSIGMYPAPPDLSSLHEDEDHDSPAQRFWIIKHGIKASGMPAWGLTHDDQRIWAMVAFLERLPELTPIQYQIITARGEDEEPPQH